MKIGLEELGYLVTSNTNGEQALVDLDRETSIVITDLIMSGVGGKEIVRQIKSTSKIPVIAVSGYKDDLIVTQKLGADALVLKPTKPIDIHQICENILRSNASKNPSGEIGSEAKRFDNTDR